ncbi:MAG: hypothetical protein A3J74_03310 [Elusimicrobia bacterium RIFCSPHIGHO2_02_FULL_57_9]|nr:MAG: hypothetical protein A3J74_03310 [Elusimicrobia bacterium RIFCSPHIGHO2_02_FULL_57_9]
MPKIYVIDDDPEWGALLLKLLKSNGFEAMHFPTAGRFFDALIKAKPDLILLDMQLAGMHGREVIRVLRQNPDYQKLLVIAVSAHDVKSEHAVKALEGGADEYLAKPIHEDLLIARIAALLRRASGNGVAAGERLRVGPLVIIPEQRRVSLNDREVELTRLEFELLLAFLRQPNRVLTRSLILETVWGGAPNMVTRTVDKHVESLRRKLGAFGKNFETVIRVGYVFKPQD